VSGERAGGQKVAVSIVGLEARTVATGGWIRGDSWVRQERELNMERLRSKQKRETRRMEAIKQKERVMREAEGEKIKERWDVGATGERSEGEVKPEMAM
jgi:hypothetical protein